jgi:FimV-like protein
MKRQIFLIAIFVAIFSFPFSILAQENNHLNRTNGTELNNLKTELETLKDNVTTTQKNSDDRFNTLNESLQNLQSGITALSQKVDSLTTTVNELKSQTNLQNERSLIRTANFLYQEWDYWAGKVGADNLRYLVVGGAILLFLLLILFLYLFGLIFRPRKIRKICSESIRHDLDFMGGREGVDIKLNLARAYLDMDQKEAAGKTIAEILQEGNSEQKKEAELLLKKLG